MIARVLATQADRDPDRLFLSSLAAQLTYGACEAAVAELARDFEAWTGARIGLRCQSTEQAVLRLLALDRVGARVYVLPPDLDPQRTMDLSVQLGLHAVMTASGELTRLHPISGTHPPGEVVLFTSGTTGTPKAALHTWASLSDRVRRRPELDASCWLLTYDLAGFGGMQVFLHALHNAGQLLLGGRSPMALARLARAGITHMSGTPTFFRLLLARSRSEDLARLKPQQITLGGEAVDQALLDALAGRFPGTQITQLYGSAEMGICFSVHDGKVGFPASYLENEAVGVVLRIVDGELYVRSPRPMLGFVAAAGLDAPAEFFPTGDLVERRGDRVFFRGRLSERINVGGSKVYPREVEDVVMELAGVLAVRVSGAASSLTGQIVCAHIVLRPGADPGAMRQTIARHCRSRLRPYQVPRQIEFLEELPQTAGGKVMRT